MTDFLFLANNLALDYANTEVMLAGVPTDLLKDFADLTEWCHKAGLAPASEMQSMASRWGETQEVLRAFQSARELRRVLHTTVEKVARTGRVPAYLATTLNRVLQDPRLVTEVAYSHGRLQISPRWALEKPDDLLVPVAHDAAHFFALADYSAIRKCENPDCILFFYDTSKNHSRRWCSMDLCGNRAKVSAFRQRH
jgi:predicted RNA-binding Zn ribbon-like protein